MSVIDAIIAKKLCGGGSVPKPLTYDYMPEGYPKKSVPTVTLMEEQELAFALWDYGLYQASPTEAVEIAVGQTYTVVWDGTEYICVSSLADAGPIIGNLSFASMGDDTGEPFAYLYIPDEAAGQFVTRDTSTSHTISIKRIEKTVITPMAAEFLPTWITELIMNSSTTGSTKKFKITVDDSGAISATEVT